MDIPKGLSPPTEEAIIWMELFAVGYKKPLRNILKAAHVYDTATPRAYSTIAPPKRSGFPVVNDSALHAAFWDHYDKIKAHPYLLRDLCYPDEYSPYNNRWRAGPQS